MKLISLNLQNFRQHRSTQVSFADGLTGIIGNNGAGKSTLVEAIAFVLYGSRALRGKVDQVRTHGISAAFSSSVELVFAIDGRNYRVYRDLSDAQLYIGGQAEHLVSGNKAVAEQIEEILGLSLEEFLASYYTEQKSLEFLSGKKGTVEREKFIIRMIGYDRLEKIQILLREERRDLKNLLMGLSASLIDPQALQIKIDQQIQKVTELKVAEQAAIRVLEQAELTSRLAQEDLKQSEQLHHQHQILQQQLAIASSGLEMLNKNLVKLADQQQELQKLLVDLLGPEAEVTQLSAELSSLRQQQTELQKILAEQEQELSQIQQAQQASIGQVKEEIAVFQSQLQQLAKKMAAINKLQTGGECPTCGQLLGSEFAQVAKGLAAEDQQLASLLQEKQQSQQQLAIPSLRQQELLDSIATNRPKLRQVSEQADRLLSCQEEILKLQGMQAESVSLKNEISKFEQQQLHVRQKITDLKYSENVYLRIKADADTRLALHHTARLQKVRNEGDLKEAEVILRRYQDDLLEYQQKNAELASKKQELLVLEESDQTLSDFRKHLNATIRPRLAELASSYLAELSDGRYANVMIAEDFTPEVMEDGYNKHLLSGGEEDLLDLCLRLALSSLITERAGHHLSFLILDEVFGSLDEGRRFNVLTLLEKLQNRFDQILLITHLEDIKDGVNNLLQINYDETSGEVQVLQDQFREIL